ncbi:MAG: hypothetical protein QGH68_04520, partial [SAR324 cluster bacterium]|nr:hypothetical protein [SAR324 cluster bacterium]
ARVFFKAAISSVLFSGVVLLAPEEEQPPTKNMRMIKNETICPGAVMDIKSRFNVSFRDFLNVEIIVEVVFKSILNIY